MKSSTAGRIAVAFSGTFSTTGMVMPMDFSSRWRASSSACDQPPSFFCEKMIIAALGSPSSLKAWAGKDIRLVAMRPAANIA